MDKEIFDKLAERVYKKTITEYEKDESSLESILVITEQDLMKYIDTKVKNAMAHNERFTELLVKEIINYYEIKT